MNNKKKIWTTVKPSETNYALLKTPNEYVVFKGGNIYENQLIDCIVPWEEEELHNGEFYVPAIDDWIPMSDFDNPLYVSIEDFEQRKREIGEENKRKIPH